MCVQSTAERGCMQHPRCELRPQPSHAASISLVSRSQGRRRRMEHRRDGLYPVSVVQPTIRPLEFRSPRSCPTGDHPSVTRWLFRGGHNSGEAVSGWLAVDVAQGGVVLRYRDQGPFRQQSFGGQATFRGVVVRTMEVTSHRISLHTQNPPRPPVLDQTRDTQPTKTGAMQLSSGLPSTSWLP